MNGSSEPSLAATSNRVHSIDVFRGLTMLVMVFANDLDMAGIRDVPNWMKHASLAMPSIPRHLIDHITFVDMIAGAFLFIVGAAIPLAMRNRRMKGDTPWQATGHVLIRTVSLLVMGVFTGAMRAKQVDPIGISHAAWSVLMLLGLMLIWNNYPAATGGRSGGYMALRFVGLAMLVGLAIVYRRHSDGAVFGMDWRNWFVLGMIGWAYLVACGVYALFRRQMAGAAACSALFLLFWIADHEGVFKAFHWLNGFRRVIPLGVVLGSHAVIATCGMMVGMLFAEDSPAATPRQRIRWIAAIGLFAFLAGLLLRPVYGLAKPGNTPTCTLYNIAICCAVYAFLYWLIDVRGHRRWADFSLPAARNPLLPYFLHYLIHPLSLALGFAWLNEYLNVGWVGIARTLSVTFLIGVVLTHLLTRAGVRLRL